MHGDLTMRRAGRQRRVSSGAAASLAATSISQWPCYLKAATLICPSRCCLTSSQQIAPPSHGDVDRCQEHLRAASLQQVQGVPRTTWTAPWLQDAAKKLNLGLSVLKRLCRDIGLVRWPYRKRHSLANVISKTQRFLVSLHLPLHGTIGCAGVEPAGCS